MFCYFLLKLLHHLLYSPYGLYNINAYDIETFIDDKNFFIPYCVCYKFKKKNNFFYFNAKDLILESILSLFLNKFKKETIYVHNLDFDGVFIIQSLTKYKLLQFKVFMRELKIYSIKIFKDDKELEFKCSYKILPLSLKKIAQSFNLTPKMIFPYKFAILNNLNYQGEVPKSDYFNTFEEWETFKSLNNTFNFKTYSIKYCLNDVIITSEFVQKIQDLIKPFKINISTSYSAPSLSLKIFIKKFNNNLISFNYSNLLDTLIRPSYFGGRCEVFGNPTSKYLYHMDFSGMYGQCMLESLPYGNYTIVRKPDNFEIPGFYWIEAYCNSWLPTLPHHRLKDNRLMFTKGFISGCYWYEEIIEAVKHETIILNIKYAVCFEFYDKILQNFVLFFNEIRAKGGEYKTFGKLMINSLYGRLGMSNIQNHAFFIENKELEFYIKKINILTYKEINDFVLINAEINNKLIKYLKNENIKTQKIKKNIALASSITSKARIKLVKAQWDVIKNKGKLLYCDTDSIFAEYDKNVGNERHGDVFWDTSLKDTEITKAVFVKPKMYGIVYKNKEEIIKIKGFNQKNITFDELFYNFYNKNKIILKDFNYFKKHSFKYENVQIDKTYLLNDYDKRKWLNYDKKNTEPYFYENFLYY